MYYYFFAGNIFSIAFFNFAGISVTKELNATTRMVLDSLRTIVIWVVSLALLWQPFEGLQILGFILIFIGMMLYNDVGIGLIKKHFKRIVLRIEVSSDEEEERLIPKSTGSKYIFCHTVLIPHLVLRALLGKILSPLHL